LNCLAFQAAKTFLVTILLPFHLLSNQRLGNLRDHFPMRMMIWIVGILALVSSLDSSLYGGFYTRGFVRMVSDMAAGFGLM